ncbi:hypothetical protein KM92DES2_12720 [uncultured Desulfovibrio sp.]|uniref:Uncharacterized protein n=1 Tax=uncultured Desulfovibrio sp. TaxID=167968 RepID=A0A212KCT2_9BACT|nr:hypothetical protein KM92DES2_12720 [uncultured Desulfovibrio sp.]
MVVGSIPLGRAINKSGCYMVFHVTSFFVFGAKYLFGCPPVTYLSVLHDRGAVGTDWRTRWHSNSV